MQSKTTHIAVTQSPPGPVHLWFELSSKLEYFRIAEILPCDVF